MARIRTVAEQGGVADVPILLIGLDRIVRTKVEGSLIHRHQDRKIVPVAGRVQSQRLCLNQKSMPRHRASMKPTTP